ncbi:MAG: PKD domain-containing protein [Nitrososphaera sp.]
MSLSTPHFPGIMGKLKSLYSSTISIGLIAILISLVFLASNVTITLAQQEEQQSLNQPSTIKIITTAESPNDSFRLQVPVGWKIHDVNNTGAMLISEVLRGFGILAQLCPEEQQTAVSNQGANTSNSSIGTVTNDNTCRDAQEDVIHIVRYPNLGAKLGFTPQDIVTDDDITTDRILAYQMQKLQEAGYRNIQIVGSTDTGINVDVSTGIDSNNTLTATLPAKLVEMTYSTNLDPYRTKTGYFISTASSVTSHDLGTITGYGIFYEGGSNAFTSSPLPPTGDAEEDENATQSSSLVLPPEPVSEVFDTFELMADPEAVQALSQAAVDQVVTDETVDNETVDNETVDNETATDGEAVDNPLTAEIISNGTQGEAPATFVFEGDALGGVGPYTISWDFDDDIDEESEEQTILHTFDAIGTYNVTFTVTDSEEQTATDSIEITVVEPSAADDEGADGAAAADDEGADDDGA